MGAGEQAFQKCCAWCAAAHLLFILHQWDGHLLRLTIRRMQRHIALVLCMGKSSGLVVHLLTNTTIYPPTTNYSLITWPHWQCWTDFFVSFLQKHLLSSFFHFISLNWTLYLKSEWENENSFHGTRFGMNVTFNIFVCVCVFCVLRSIFRRALLELLK